MHDKRNNAIAQVLQRLMKPRRRIGFPIPGEDDDP